MAVVVVAAVVVMVDWSVDSYTQLEPMTTWRCLLLVADFCRTATERERPGLLFSLSGGGRSRAKQSAKRKKKGRKQKGI